MGTKATNSRLRPRLKTCWTWEGVNQPKLSPSHPRPVTCLPWSHKMQQLSRQLLPVCSQVLPSPNRKQTPPLPLSHSSQPPCNLNPKPISSVDNLLSSVSLLRILALEVFNRDLVSHNHRVRTPSTSWASNSPPSLRLPPIPSLHSRRAPNRRNQRKNHSMCREKENSGQMMHGQRVRA